MKKNPHKTTKENKIPNAREAAAQLRQQIQQRLENKTVLPPEEIIAQMREERSQKLLAAYRQMAQDELRETEALEWIEATIEDANDEAE